MDSRKIPVSVDIPSHHPWREALDPWRQSLDPRHETLDPWHEIPGHPILTAGAEIFSPTISRPLLEI